MKLVQEAAEFAVHAHRGLSYGKQPYFYHLAATVGIMVEHDVEDEIMLAAAWLHDIIEDTPWSAESLRGVFGDQVATLVWCCTGQGANRKARFADIASKIRETDPDAAVIKAADRLANMRNCFHTANWGLMKMYRKEADDFHRLLDSVDGGVHERLRVPLKQMKAELARMGNVSIDTVIKGD